MDEFEAHRTIVTRAFEYLEKENKKQTESIGGYLVFWLPYHLEQLRCLEYDDKGTLKSNEKLEIGQNLYRLFKDDQVIRRHRTNFEQAWWEVDEMENVQKWLTDSAVVQRLDKKWLDGMHADTRPTRGFLKELVKIVVEGFLREREWKVASAYYWIELFMSLVSLLVTYTFKSTILAYSLNISTLTMNRTVRGSSRLARPLYQTQPARPPLHAHPLTVQLTISTGIA